MEHEIKPKFDLIDDKVAPIPRIDDLLGMFQTVSTAPTATPKRIINQIQIYTNGGTLRLYWYDTTNNTWHYVTATA